MPDPLVGSAPAPAAGAPQRTTAWFHCFAGIAGDMALGALLDAGADLDQVRRLLDRLPVGGWELDAELVMRNGIGATKAVVTIKPSTVVRTYAHISGLIEEARLPDRVRNRALTTFGAIAAAEGRIHRRPAEEVHFHEVGGLDAIIDIVGTAAALEVLGVDHVAASPVTHGTGVIPTSHGVLPNPPPAVVELLAGAPSVGIDLNVELTTPTGAGLLAALAETWGALPSMTIGATGFGAGTRELEALPNLCQVVVGHAGGAMPAGQPLVLLEANVDDATGEALADAVATLLATGAADAWLTPIVMKKGRPAYTVSALADVARAGELAMALTTATGSLGVRATGLDRWPQPRRLDQVEVDGMHLGVKVGTDRVKVEHDDAVRVARHTGRTVAEVVSLAEETWRRDRAEAGAGEVVHLPSSGTGPHPSAG